MLAGPPGRSARDPEDASLEHQRRPTARPDARRNPTWRPSLAGFAVRPSHRRHAHRAVLAGRSTIARSARPPSRGPRGHPRRDHRPHDHARRDQLGDAAARPRALPVRARPGRIGRQLHGPQHFQRGVREIPDPAEQLGRLGPLVPRQLDGPADPGEPGDRRPPQGDRALRLARFVAGRRPLVADGFG